MANRRKKRKVPNILIWDRTLQRDLCEAAEQLLLAGRNGVALSVKLAQAESRLCNLWDSLECTARHLQALKDEIAAASESYRRAAIKAGEARKNANQAAKEKKEAAGPPAPPSSPRLPPIDGDVLKVLSSPPPA